MIISKKTIQQILKNNEDLNNIEYLGIGLCNYNYKKSDLRKIFNKFYKFWRDLD